MKKSFDHIVCSKKWPIFEISADKWPDMSWRKIGRYGFILIEFNFSEPISIEPKLDLSPYYISVVCIVRAP